MSRTQTMLAAAVGAALTSSAAFATITVIPTLVPVTIPAAAISGSGSGSASLSNYETYDLKVSISPGDFWAGADIRAQALNGAQWFAADNSGGDYTPTFRTGGTGNYYAFDTAVTAPGFQGGRATILGSSSRKTPPDSNATFPSNGSNWGTGQDDTFTWTSWVPANGMQLVDATWGDPSAATNTATGVQTIARLTITKAPTNQPRAHIVGQVKATSDATLVTFFTFDIPPIPEPTSVALMGLGLGAVALRRRSR